MNIFSDYFEHIQNLNSIKTVQSEYVNYLLTNDKITDFERKENLSAKNELCVIKIAIFVEQNDYWGEIILSAKTVCSSAAIKRPRTKYGLK